MKNLTEPLEAEIRTTNSWWVKIRNRLYIILTQQAVNKIVEDEKKRLHRREKAGMGHWERCIINSMSYLFNIHDMENGAFYRCSNK